MNVVPFVASFEQILNFSVMLSLSMLFFFNFVCLGLVIPFLKMGFIIQNYAALWLSTLEIFSKLTSLKFLSPPKIILNAPFSSLNQYLILKTLICLLKWKTILVYLPLHYTEKEFTVKDFFRKCEEIHRKLQVCSHLLKKLLAESFISCSVLT